MNEMDFSRNLELEKKLKILRLKTLIGKIERISKKLGKVWGIIFFLIKEICVLLYRRKDNIKFIQKSKKLYGTFGE